jgi:hypothetical protein
MSRSPPSQKPHFTLYSLFDHFFNRLSHSSKDVFEHSKTIQRTTLINESEFQEDEKVTVIDPRHPLYGQTFSLISIENRKDRGLCCLVTKKSGQNLYLPLEVTDKDVETNLIAILPLSVQGIQQLVQRYRQLVEKHEDEDPKTKTKHRPKTNRNHRSKTSPSTNDLVSANCKTATTCSSETRNGLPESSESFPKAGGGTE